MVRIITGIHRGRRLVTPEGTEVRPTSDRARLALFNILGTWIKDKVVLDLYAGCGSVGFECLSRGAARVVFVEGHPASLACLDENTKALGEAARVDIRCADVPAALTRLGGTMFDLIFADPPYREQALDLILEQTAAAGVAGPDTVLIVEHEAERDIAAGYSHAGWECYRTATYGKPQFSFFSWSEVS